MDLELGSGRTLADPTDADLHAYLPTEAFLTLAAGPSRFLRARRGQGPHGDYALDEQRGSAHEHYQAVDRGPITSERVLAALLAYRRGETAWRESFRWQRQDEF